MKKSIIIVLCGALASATSHAAAPDDGGRGSSISVPGFSIDGGSSGNSSSNSSGGSSVTTTGKTGTGQPLQPFFLGYTQPPLAPPIPSILNPVRALGATSQPVSGVGTTPPNKVPYRLWTIPAVGNHMDSNAWIKFGASEGLYALMDYFGNPGLLVNVKTGQVVIPEALDKAQVYGVPGVYTRTLDDAIEFGKTIGADIVRWNQSSGPIADLLKAGFEKAGIASALNNAVATDILAGGNLREIIAHSMGTAVVGNALYDVGLIDKLEGGASVYLYAPIIGDAVKNNPAGATVDMIRRPFDAVTYLGRSPFSNNFPSPTAAIVLLPAAPWQHPIAVYKKGEVR